MTLRSLLAALLLCAPLAAGAVEPITAGPALGHTVAETLERGHYDRRPIDSTMSAQFLLNVLESYDYNHLIFTKADIDGFTAAYGDTLGARVRGGDVGAAYAVYDRFMKRLAERRAFVARMVASTVTFTADESAALEGHKLPWPANAAEADERWRLNIKFELLRSRLEGAKDENPVKVVTDHYDSLTDNYKTFEANDVLQNFLSGLCRVYDPHTDYFTAPKEDNFHIGMRLSLVGIGAALRTEKGYTSVLRLVPGGPAEVDKRLKPGDKIVAVAQGDAAEFTDVVGMKIDRVVELIRGKEGTVVRLRVIPADAAAPDTRVLIRLVRAEIHLRDQEAKAKLLQVPGPDGRTRPLGVIDLPSFYADMRARGEGKSTTRDVAALLASLRKKGAEGLVLDLRRNGGGSLQEALALTGLFIGDGPVVQVKDTSGGVTVLESGARAVSHPEPLVVLTSRGSASASEILAGALQDYGRAVVVGAKSTFGKGTVQTVIDLDRMMPPSLGAYKAGAVHLTIQKFYRVSGGSTQNRGVIPDVTLPSVEDEMEIAESALPNALPYDRIAPVGYPASPQVTALLPRLLRASQERVAASAEWAYVREDIAAYKDDLAKKSVSVNEAKRRAEKAADEARDAKRRKERAVRAVPPQVGLDITLEALEGVALSTAPAQAPKPSTGPVEKDKDEDDESYAKAGPAPDLMLEESLNVLSDLIAQTVDAASAPKRFR
ncbi:MAG: carboxy terminal-processing peptidase [Elusimicrobia bacterium]|nr:carboxy terminal-processing peptidase [Elusimicrobiota bacterium]